MAARSGSYLIVTSILTAIYLGGLYFTFSAENRGPLVRVLKWVFLGILTPAVLIGVPTFIAKKVLESRRQSPASPESPRAEPPASGSAP